MPAVSALFALLFLATILGTIGLWYAIDRETDGSETMSRDDAERAARQDTRDGDREAGDQDDRDDDWGTDAEWGVESSDDRQ